MRSSLLTLLLFAAVVVSAQDSNFSAGPQYLMNYGSPLFLQPIATPSLSLSGSPANLPAAASESGAETEAAPTSAGTKVQTELPRIYYGESYVSASAGERVSEIEISSQEPSTLPADFVNVGVSQMTGELALRDRGYGVTPGEAAAYWKAHRIRASRIYTNADVARLHGG